MTLSSPQKILETALLLGIAVSVSAQPPVSNEAALGELRQRLTGTARRALLLSQKNPFRQEVLVGADSEGGSSVPSHDPLISSLSNLLTRAGTDTWSLPTDLSNPYLLPEGLLEREKLAQWDWRGRLRWFRESGFSRTTTAPADADATPASASPERGAPPARSWFRRSFGDR
jgi:hypothetical protein